MSVAISTSYSGEVLADFIVEAATGNDTVDLGSIKVQTGIQHEYTLPTLRVSNIVQKHTATPVSGVGTFTFGERKLKPNDFLVYTEFNPRDFESFWKFGQPTGNLVFRKLDSQVQIAMVSELMKELNNHLGSEIWHGVSEESPISGTFAGTPTDGLPISADDTVSDHTFFNGLLPRILQDYKDLAADEKPILSGSTEITNTTEILAALNGVFNAIPKSIRRKKDLKILLDLTLFDLYDQALIESNFKHANYTNTNVERFRGIEIVPTNGVPVSTIVAAIAGTGIDSNLWFGLDYQNDGEVLQIEKKEANSELYFFKMLMKGDTVVAKPKELVFHTTYTLVA
tara:strand:- start:494 stop:1516 length:1023 start_codon:yes stop_codon:yes gene_type:complete